MTEPPKKVVFAEGCFDALVEDGMTQEEIDAFKAEVERMFASGEAEANSRPVDDADFAEIEEALSKRKTRQ